MYIIHKFLKRTASLSIKTNDSQEAESTKKKAKLVNQKYDKSYVRYGYLLVKCRKSLLGSIKLLPKVSPQIRHFWIGHIKCEVH